MALKPAQDSMNDDSAVTIRPVLGNRQENDEK